MCQVSYCHTLARIFNEAASIQHNVKNHGRSSAQVTHRAGKQQNVVGGSLYWSSDDQLQFGCL